MQVEDIADHPMLVFVELAHFAAKQGQRLDLLANVVLRLLAAEQAHDQVRHDDERLEQ